MKVLHSPVTAICILTITSIYVNGCNNNTSSPAQSTSIPSSGTTMTQIWEGSGYEVTSTITVVPTTLTDEGESSAKVIGLVEVDQNSNVDSTFQSYRADGDIALDAPAWGESGTFYPIPFTTTSSINTNYNGPGGMVNLSAVHNGPGKSYVLNGTSYATDSATVLQTVAGQTTQFHYTRIPSLGIIVRMVTQPDPASGQDGQSQWITSYIAK